MRASIWPSAGIVNGSSCVPGRKAVCGHDRFATSPAGDSRCRLARSHCAEPGRSCGGLRGRFRLLPGRLAGQASSPEGAPGRQQRVGRIRRDDALRGHSWRHRELQRQYRAPLGRDVSLAGPACFRCKTNAWTDWSLDGRNPTQVTVDGVGRFVNGVGTFFADDTFAGKPIRVRGTFTPVPASSARWEQAFSADGGRTWETNYIMLYTR
jgi:hypothetical protein